jgi:hypothetical protein
LISSLTGPTAYWALIPLPDRGAPIALRYKKRWGPATHNTRLTVSHSGPPTTRVRSERVRSQRWEAPLPSPPLGLCHLDVFTAAVDFTTSLPLLPAVTDFTDRRCPVCRSTTAKFFRRRFQTGLGGGWAGGPPPLIEVGLPAQQPPPLIG